MSIFGERNVFGYETVAKTSATAFFFADILQEYLNIPVGIIISCWGGSTIETWIARARITSNRKIISVWSENVSHPVAVRYCWRDWTKGSVFNNFGIPLAPFRTDDWELEEVL